GRDGDRRACEHRRSRMTGRREAPSLPDERDDARRADATRAGRDDARAAHGAAAHDDKPSRAEAGAAASDGEPRPAAVVGTTRPVLAVDRLAVRRGGRTIFDDLAVAVSAGEIVGVVGRNGCGKSTLLMAIAGVLAPKDGRITV